MQMSDQLPTHKTLSLEETTVSNMWEIADYSPLRKLLEEGFLMMNHATSARFVSPWFNILSIMLFTILPTLWGGCAITTTLDGKLLQGYGTDGTSVLGEVTSIRSREEMEKGAVDKEHKFLPMYQELLNNRFSDQELNTGKVVIILYQWYQHNPSRTHDVLDWAIVEKGVKVKKGNVVELQLRKPYAIVTGILYNDVEEGKCEFIKGDRGGLAALDMVNILGGPATANLYCPKLEQEGWQKTPFGMYKGGFLMTKPPKT